MEYPKTENLFVRDPGTHKLKLWDYRCPEFAAINRWSVTEKIDGMNIRVFAPTGAVRGRTDNANLPTPLVEWLQAHLSPGRLAATFQQPAILFGEGYGGKIQKGSGYRPTQAFRLFDVWLDGDRHWMPQDEMRALALALDIPYAPFLGIWETASIVEGLLHNSTNLARTAQEDGGTNTEPEGVVAVSEPYLYDRYGQRIKFKLKTKDLK